MRKWVAAICSTLLVLSVGASPASGEQTDNVRLIARFPFKGGLELASLGDRVYASEWNGVYDRLEDPKKGGVHIFDVSGRPRQVGFLACPGYDNDIAVLDRGLIAIGYGQNACSRELDKPGVLLADVSNPRRPRTLGSASVYFAHTISVHPEKPLIYASPGGWLPVDNEGHVDIVDASNPARPKVVGRFTYPGYGCHDISFAFSNVGKLGFCVTSGPEQLILGMSDPLNPTIIGHIVNPLIQYGHTALASPDGQLLAITDEAFVAHECASGQTPTGRVWFYDISNPHVPVLVGSYAPPTGSEPVGYILGWLPSYCAAAMIDWIPGSRKIAVTMYTGGTEILDLSDPSAPKVVARYRPKKAMPYGVDFHGGRVYVNDINRGVEVLEIDGL